MSDESDGFNEEEYKELGYESGSAGTFGTLLGELLCGVGFPLCVTLSADDFCDGDGRSLVPYLNVHGAFFGGYKCNECTR